MVLFKLFHAQFQPIILARMLLGEMVGWETNLEWYYQQNQQYKNIYYLSVMQSGFIWARRVLVEVVCRFLWYVVEAMEMH